ncbi:2-oxo acid dehydrogenase subunit E2 [Salinactinospora qingdaonensis]|uniref:2-oxoacid dehydrogenase acyltransferase catalytic domain-containing protein n=1 Tax=Salinactinospora qingdaonensis TaxID=702744 RepID=A0ABP7F630_9ACTN
MAEPTATAEDPRGSSTLTRPSGLRRRIGAHMVDSLATSPHAATAVEVRFDRVLATRAAHGGERPPGVVAFVGWACARAIAEFPLVNASWEEGGIRVFDHVGLGVAVDLDHAGLVVPVVRHAEELTPTQLQERIDDLTSRARERRLGVADLEGGTFTVSSLGRSGTLFTIPVINQPQSAILSCDTVTSRPVVEHGADGPQVGIGQVGVLTASFDHRTFDGAYCAAFLDRVRTLLESC